MSSASSDTSESESELSLPVTSYHRRNNDVEQEEETADAGDESSSGEEDDFDDYAYDGEPLADQEWIDNYRRERVQHQREMEMFQRRLNGSEPLHAWWVDIIARRFDVVPLSFRIT